MLIAHYTSIEKALSRIIPTQKLRCGKLTNTNDPYEVRMDWHLGTTFSGSNSEDVMKKIDSNAVEREKIKEKFRICCLSACDDGSFSCGNNTHLWTYYASAKDGIAQGCALIFESDALIKNIRSNTNQILLHAGRVDYLDAEKIYQRNGGDASIDAFMIKPKRWFNEQEFRIIIENPSKNVRHDFIDISSALKGIVLNGMQLNLINERYVNYMNSICGSNVKWIRRIYNSVTHEFELMELSTIA